MSFQNGEPAIDGSDQDMEAVFKIGAGLIKKGSTDLASSTGSHGETFSLRGCVGVLEELAQIVRVPNTNDVPQRSPQGAETMCGCLPCFSKADVISNAGQGSQNMEPGQVAQIVCALVNGPLGTCATRNAFGRLVPEGSIRFINHNGKIEAVPPGRWLIGFQRASWGDMVTINEQNIVYENAKVIRVPRGSYGLARDKGDAVILDAGLHVYNDPTFTFERMIDMNTTYIGHGTLHVIRIPKGQYGKIWASSQHGGLIPRLLAEGVHVVDSALFKFEGVTSVQEMHISHGAVNILRVPKGQVVKAIDAGRPELLGEGLHVIDSATFSSNGLASLTDQCITHGTITLLRVNKGEVAAAWHSNEPLLLDTPGRYGYDDSNFVFVRHQSLADKVITLGARKIVMVNAGEVGISYNKGVLQVLEPGRHILEDASHVFDDFLSTQQRILRLTPRVPEQKALMVGRDDNENKGLFLVCETKDFVKVGLRADVFYSVANPSLTIQVVKRQEIDELVYETAVATLTNVVRCTALNEVAQNAMPSAVSAKAHQEDAVNAQAVGQPSAPLFFDRAHDEFLSKLHDDFQQRYGIEIINIRIENFRIMNDELASNISSQVLKTAETEQQLANLKGQQEIATRDQERIAAVKQISTKAEAEALNTKIAAENNAKISSAEASAKADASAIIERAKAEAEAVRIKAEADAHTIRIKAEAEAHAIDLKAKAEAKRAELLSKTPLGQQLSLAVPYMEMMQKVGESVEKVVYCDSTLQRTGNPFNLPSLQALNSDLQLLNEIGDATRKVPNGVGTDA
eukprot:gnl/MRDRNA2_/MRDRNA2_28371_c0_seq1.p1 gnl/MRDRNA2_/MRDRNA2_28371_c0~~gnl/MRDRNA2_/MRDRNA2_28371_c0_seq1.p1  ORF type:complete len:798 (+),score=166.15 gnl/MRDRNA2_/MRDRNA2_28371_c0_seq1:99-2492(+)